MIQKFKKQSATTLIEIIFYFVIVSVLLLAAMNFSIQILNVSKESDNFHEIQSNIDFVSQKIISTIEEADSINDADSIFNNNNGRLSLNMPSAEISPTVFYISNGDVYIQEGLNPAIKINSTSIECILLKFQVVSYVKAPDQIVIDASFKPKYTDIKNLEQTLPLHTSVSLRKL